MAKLPSARPNASVADGGAYEPAPVAITAPTGLAQSSFTCACADGPASMPHIIAACNSASFPADEDRVIFDFDVSEAATHVPEDSFHTALKILFMNEGCLTI